MINSAIPGIKDNFHDYCTKYDESQGSGGRCADSDLNTDPNGGGTDVVEFSSK